MPLNFEIQSYKTCRCFFSPPLRERSNCVVLCREVLLGSVGHTIEVQEKKQPLMDYIIFKTRGGDHNFYEL